MMDRQYMQAHPEVDWGVYNKQQSVPPQLQDYRSSQEGQDQSNTDVPLGSPDPARGESLLKHGLAGFLGAAQGISKLLPDIGLDKYFANRIGYHSPVPSFEDTDFKGMLGIHDPTGGPQKYAEMAGSLALPLPPLLKVGGDVAKPIASGMGSALDYLNPSKAAESFRSSMGSGTSSQNIADLAKRAQFAKQSAKSEALAPKNELYSQEGGSNVYGDNGNTNSAYLSDPNVTVPYSPYGKLIKLHDAYQNDSTMNNYQALRSAITTQMRKLNVRAKTDDVAAEKLDQMQTNLGNLDNDANSFIQTLPQNMQDLDSQFRQKYTQFAKTYNKGDKETGASLTLRRLAEGRHDLVDDNDVVGLFSNPTAADKQAILDMGDFAGRNAVYAALQRVPSGDAEKMANTVLDLKRTKGFDNIITPDMENWANNMLKQVTRASMIKKTLSTAGLGAAGAAIGGPVGGLVGAALPWGKEYLPAFGKILASKLKK